MQRRWNYEKAGELHRLENVLCNATYGEAMVRVCPRAAGTSAATKAAMAKDFIVMVVKYLKEW